MVDQKAIAAHQWVVDVTERQPAWWAENLAWAYVAFGIVGTFLKPDADRNLIWTGVLLLAGVVMVFVARSPAHFTMMGSKNLYRLFFWVDIGTRTVLFIYTAENWKLAYIVNSCLALSYLYFTACKPPQPRKRRQAIAQGSAA